MNAHRARWTAASSSARTAGGLTLGFALAASGPMREAHAATSNSVNTWLSVGTDNSITLTIGASDMGQGSVQGLAQVLAEDLMVDFSRVTTGAGHAHHGDAGAGGRGHLHRRLQRHPQATTGDLRDAGAIARETLVQAAMNRQGDSYAQQLRGGRRRHHAPAHGASLDLRRGGRRRGAADAAGQRAAGA